MSKIENNNNSSEPQPRPVSGRKRLVRRALASTAAVGLLTAGVATLPDAAEKAADYVEGKISPDVPDGERESYTVQSGDTAWDIAEERTHGDPRPLVDDIQEQAGADGLQPGEDIQVPPTTAPEQPVDHFQKTPEDYTITQNGVVYGPDRPLPPPETHSDKK